MIRKCYVQSPRIKRDQRTIQHNKSNAYRQTKQDSGPGPDNMEHREW